VPEGTVRVSPQPLIATNAIKTPARRTCRLRTSNPNGSKIATHINCRVQGISGASSRTVDNPVATVTDTFVVPPSPALAGFTVHIECAGTPEHVNAAVPGSPTIEVSSNAYVASCPLEIAIEAGPFEASEKSTPVPVRASVCGELAALSLNVTVPVRTPATVGVNTTCTVQTPAGANVLPQVLPPASKLKSPLAAIPATVSGTPPLFVRVTVCDGATKPTPTAPKLNPPTGDSETPGGASPIPLNETV